MNSAKNFSFRKLALPVFLPSTLFSIGTASLVPIVPTAAESLGASLATAGLIVGMITFGALTFVLPASKLVNRIGERRSMMMAGIVGALSSASLIFTDSLIVIAIAVFINGGMEAVFGLARHGYMTEHVPFNYRARALAVLGGTFRAGGFLGPLLGAGAVTLFSFKGAFAASAIVCALAAITLLAQKDDAHTRPDPDSKLTLRKVVKRELPKLATIGVGTAALVFVRTGRIIGLPLWGIYLGMPAAQIALYIGIAGAVDFALFYVSGQIMDRFGRRASIVPTMIALGVCMMSMVFATTPDLFLVIAVALSIANALSSGIILTLGADLAPKDGRNEFLASFRMLADVGAAASPVAISAITAAFALPVAFVAVGVVSLVGAAGLWHYLPKFGIR